jgi:type II restriction enzyme
MIRRGFKCKEDVLLLLEKEYDKVVKKEYEGNYMNAIKVFDNLTEEKLRLILNNFYTNIRSRNQAWKTCKGSLYEYAVFRLIEQVVKNSEILQNKLTVLLGDDVLYK